MEQRLPDESDLKDATAQIAAFVFVLCAVVGFAEQGWLTLFLTAGAGLLSCLVGRRNWKLAAMLGLAGASAMFLPVFHAPAFATIIGAGAGVIAGRIQERNDISLQQAELLSGQNREVAASQLELLKSDEVNRYLLAADLHDQALNDQKAVVEALYKHKSTLEREEFNNITNKLSAVMTETRDIMDKLYPAQLNVIGLTDTLDAMLSRACRAAKCKARFRDRSAPELVAQLNELETIVIYRVVEEAITNAIKHAQASTITLELSSADSELIISVSDDGKGIERQIFEQPGRGLKFIMVRADVIGAIVGWTDGADRRGTTCELRVPL